MEVRRRHILLHECKGKLKIVNVGTEERRKEKLYIPKLNGNISETLRKNSCVLIIGMTFFCVVGFQNSSGNLYDEFLNVPKTSVVVETDEFLEVPETSVVIEPTINLKNSTCDLEVETIKKELIFNGSIVTKAEERLVNLEKDAKKTEELEESEEEEPIAVISAYGPSETYYYQVTDEEKEELAKVVWREAVGECMEGKVAVAATVLNRFTSGRSDFDSSSIHSIITQRGAFANIENVSTSDLTDECFEAVEMALKGYDPTRVMFPSGAYFFFNPDGDLNEKTRAEREGIQVYVIGNHWFHTDLN
jgi:spore germination cell wall hydrolase CwlJ-like protein